MSQNKVDVKVYLHLLYRGKYTDDAVVDRAGSEGSEAVRQASGQDPLDHDAEGTQGLRVGVGADYPGSKVL